jgi:hypothetical protein
MDSNGIFYGTILAPNARVLITSNFQLFGSCAARSVELDSNAFFHFDKALLDVAASGPANVDVVMLREIPFQGGPGLRTAAGGCEQCEDGVCERHTTYGQTQSALR